MTYIGNKFKIKGKESIAYTRERRLVHSHLTRRKIESENKELQRVAHMRMGDNRSVVTHLRKGKDRHSNCLTWLLLIYCLTR